MTSRTVTPGGRAQAPGLSRWVRPAVGLIVAAAFLYLTLHRLDWASVRDAWSGADRGLLAIGVLALAAGYALRIARWWWMLRVLDPSLPYAACVRPFLASIAVNNTVPLRAGDFVRAFGFRGALGVPPAQVLGTLVVERVLDMFVLLALFFAGLLGVARGAVPPAFVTAGTVLFALSLGGILLLVFAPRFVALLVGRLLLGPLAGRPAAARLYDAASQFFATLTRVLTPARAAQLLALSALSWALEGGLFVMVAAALHLGVAAPGPWFALATGTLATLLPSSPGYVGTFDYFAILGLTAYGATRTAAAAFALLTHFLLWLPPTVVGALSFLSLRGRAERGVQPSAAATG